MPAKEPVSSGSSADDLLSVSIFDRVAGGIVAGICVTGFFVSVLFTIWLTRRPTNSTTTVPISFIEARGGAGDGGVTRGFEEPELSEVTSLLEPNLEDVVATVTDLAQQAARPTHSTSGFLAQVREAN